MMPKINLLPGEFRKERKLDLPGLLVKAFLAALLLSLVALYSAFFTSYQDQKKQLAAVQVELDKYAPAMAKLNMVKKTKQELAQIDAFLLSLKSDKIFWSEFLISVREAAPSGLKLSEISVGDKDLMIIKGETTAFPLVGLYYLKLKDSPYLKDFAIDVITEEILPGGTLVIRFTLKGHVQKGGSN